MPGVPSKHRWAATAFYQNRPAEAVDADHAGAPAPPSAALDKANVNAGETRKFDWSQTVAAKHDDADTDTTMWDFRALAHLKIEDADHYDWGLRALNLLRRFLHRRW